MAATAPIAILRDLQTLFDFGTAAGMTDRQLLERFADRRDPSSDAAFEFLILRHGPMILRVCRNMLRDEADVSDAFQATFLVLVRRRETLGKLESVGGWLYGVACRVAARARVEAARRQRAEQRAALRVVERIDLAEDTSMSTDFGPAVQEEVRRLPVKYRDVVVMCYWQSQTHEQAAAQIGCPLGTVRSRLSRARKLLHRRLTRRGLAPLAALVTTALDASTVTASPLGAVPAALVKQTIDAASAAASGQALSCIVSETTASLIQRVAWSSAMIKFKSAMLGLFLIGVVGVGTAVVFFIERRGQAQMAAAAQLPPPGPPEDLPGTAVLRSMSREGRTIVSVIANGSMVKKGDLVCEFESLEAGQALTSQRIVTIHARTAHRRNETALEIAELGLEEYQNGLGVLEQQEAHLAVKKAEAQFATADGQFAASKTDKDAATRTNAARELELAKARESVLLHYTRAKRIKELGLAIEVAKAELQASKEVWELEVSKEKPLAHEIETSRIVAPRDGKLVYYYGPEGSKPRFGAKTDGSSAPWPFIEIGAYVQPQQILFKVIPVNGESP